MTLNLNEPLSCQFSTPLLAPKLGGVVFIQSTTVWSKKLSLMFFKPCKHVTLHNDKKESILFITTTTIIITKERQSSQNISHRKWMKQTTWIWPGQMVSHTETKRSLKIMVLFAPELNALSERIFSCQKFCRETKLFSRTSPQKKKDSRWNSINKNQHLSWNWVNFILIQIRYKNL